MRITLTQDITPSPSARTQQGPLALGQGEVIRAAVVSVQGETVSLKTEDGRMFSARLASGTVLIEHDTVELMAGESAKGEQPILRVVFVEPGQSEITAREAAGVKAKAVLTQQLAEAFQQMNLKPTPKLVSLASQILKNYPVDAKIAAFFAANNIPATTESIRAFESILAGKQFGAAFYEIVQDAAAALGRMHIAANSATESMQTPLLQIWPDGAVEQHAMTRSTPAVAEGQSGTATPTGTGTGLAVTEQQIQQTTQAVMQQEDTALPKAGTQTQPITGQEPERTAGEAQGQSPAQPQMGENPPRPAFTPGIPVLILGEDAAAGTAGEQVTAQAKGAGTSEIAPVPVLEYEAPALDLGGAPNKEAIAKDQGQPQQAASGQPNAQPPQEESGLIKTRAAQAQEVRADGSPRSAGGAQMAVADGPVPQDAQTLPGSSHAAQAPAHSPYAAKGEEKAVLKGLLDLFLKAGEDLDARTLKKSVEETPQKILELQKLIKNTDIHTQETLASRFQELTAQAKLAEDISRFVFVQIPIHLKEYGSAELYIYKRNRREKGAERQSTCVVLGLSTQNLGRVEAMLRIENRDVSLELRVQNQNELAAFRECSGELQQSFTELRYQLKEYKVAPLREPTTPLNAEEKLVRMHNNSGGGLDVII